MTHTDFLRALEADQLGHSGADLLSHLQGVESILAGWDAPEHLRAAGLYHSVYGTESYSRTTLDLALRDRLRAQIGEQAELLVFYFGVMKKEPFYDNLQGEPPYRIACRLSGEEYAVTEQQFRDLCELTVANWLEQRPRAGEKHQFIRADEFRAMRPHLSPAAWHAIDTAYGFTVTAA